jgi:hypothetical protein
VPSKGQNAILSEEVSYPQTGQRFTDFRAPKNGISGIKRKTKKNGSPML